MNNIIFICQDCSNTWDLEETDLQCVECGSANYEEIEDNLEMYVEDEAIDQSSPLCYNDDGELVSEFNVLSKYKEASWL